MEEIIKYKGPNPSGTSNVNFLFRENNIFISDNHRTALWCWLQLIQEKKKYNFFHIDQHEDFNKILSNSFTNKIDDIKSSSIHEYLKMEDTDPISRMNFPLITWNNYLTFFFTFFQENIKEFYVSTHGENSRFTFLNKKEVNPWEMINKLKSWLEESNNKWIVNIDLDYFFCNKKAKNIKMFADDYIIDFFAELNKCNKKKLIQVITISLSPEFTGGWETAEHICNLGCEQLGINFMLKY